MPYEAGELSVNAQINWNVIFEFASPELRSYKQRSQRRLNIILDQLDLSSNANLGYTKVTWLPDHIARIRYTVMEGILQPIVVVRIEFQESFLTVFDLTLSRQAALQKLLEEEEEEEKEKEGVYIPFAWIGIRAVNHSLGEGAEDNTNCDFWGAPIDPNLVGFEPLESGAEVDKELGYGFQNTCEPNPGFILYGNSWAEHIPFGNPTLQKTFVVSGGKSWSMNQFGLDQGTFIDSFWDLPPVGEVSASQSNMVLLELLDVAAVGVPPEAEGWGARRAIVIGGSGITFPNGGLSQVIPLGGGAAVTMSATYAGGSIGTSVLRGEYEIQAYSQSFPCECTQADIEIRVIVGETGGPVTVYDFSLDGIGNPPEENTQQYFRDRTMGGFEDCDPSPVNALGPNNHGIGWWNQSILIDVANGRVSQGPARVDAPFFSLSCPPTKRAGPSSPECGISCTGLPVVQPANNLDFPGTSKHISSVTTRGVGAGGEAIQYISDVRGGIIWHLARVHTTNQFNGHICRVRLVGNDGGQGGCKCRPFSYGTNLPATGITPDLPLGIDLTKEPGNGIVPYSIGELVVVVGFTNQLTTPCFITPGDWRVIVTRTEGGHGEEFRNLFWSQLRCGEAEPVERFFKTLELAMLERDPCDGDSLIVECNYGSKCTEGSQLTCVDTNSG